MNSKIIDFVKEKKKILLEKAVKSGKIVVLKKLKKDKK